jgi:hypothetical protein
MEGDIAIVIILLLRFLIPFTILRWPLAGTILAIIGDTIDIMLLEAFGYGFLEGLAYSHVDKVFDTWALFFEFLVVLRWKDILARNTGIILFGWRLLGFFVFLVINLREVFFFAPNIFEYFFIVMLVIWKFNDKFKLDWKKLTIILLLVGIPNIIKEYFMHYTSFSIWAWTRDNFLWWLYD